LQQSPIKRDYILQKSDIYISHVSIRCLEVDIDELLPVVDIGMGWLHVVSSIKLQVSFAKEPYERDDILQKRPIILRSLLIVATPYVDKSDLFG
jgi:hypothetical protein